MGSANVVALVGAWGACWAIAYAIKPRSASTYAGTAAAPSPSSPTRPTSEGWGR